jgi:hypothetical protein
VCVICRVILYLGHCSTLVGGYSSYSAAGCVKEIVRLCCSIMNTFCSAGNIC